MFNLIQFNFRRIVLVKLAWPRGVIGSAYDSTRGPWFDTKSGHILSFIIMLIQEGQLSVTGT